jgi:iron complex outermembrane receptor protein
MSIKRRAIRSGFAKESLTGFAAATVLATGLVVPSGAVLAQDDSGAVLDEITVTSRRYEESISDAPLAVSVMDGEYLAKQGVNTLSDALELTPGATWGHYTMAQPGHTLRGMESYNSGNATLESSVQMVVDGIPLTKAFMMTPPVYDMERIEVMRGPQGTTFGRNASLGIAHFVTAKPSQEFSASVQASAGSRDYYGLTGHINGAVSDTVSVRVAANKMQYDGDLEHEDTGKSLEGENNWALRASALFEPSDTFSAYLKLDYMVDRGVAPARRFESCTVPSLTSPPYFEEYTAPCDIWKTAQSSEPRDGFYQNRDMTFVTAELIWNRGNVNITSLTGYQWGNHAVINDVFSSPEVIQDQHVINDGNVFSTELRLDNHGGDSSIRWLAGIYLLSDDEYRLEQNIGAPPRGDGAGRITGRGTSDLTARGWAETESLGIFGEIAFDIGDRVEVAIGGRYTDESKEYDFTNQCFGRIGACAGLGNESEGYEEYYDPATDCSNPANQDLANGTCGSAGDPMGIGVGDPLYISKSWDDFSVKASVSFALSDNTNIYALYSEAFKSGGFHHDARTAGQFYESVLDPENTENFEIGLKGSYDRFRYAITAFAMEQVNAQNSALVPLPGGSYITALANFGGIEQSGVEFEATWAVSENILVGGNMAFYDGELGPGSVLNGSWDPDCSCFIGTDVSGTPTGMDSTWVLFAEYNANFSGGSALSFRIDNQYRSTVAPPANRTTVTNLDGTGLAFERPAINNLGLNVSWVSATGGTEVTLWGRNLLEEADYGGFGPASSFWFNNGGSGPGTSPRNYWGRARYGVDLRLNFN